MKLKQVDEPVQGHHCEEINDLVNIKFFGKVNLSDSGFYVLNLISAQFLFNGNK